MKKPLLLNFVRYSDVKLETLASRIVSQMTGNDYFSDRQDLVQELGVVTDQFFQAEAQTSTRDLLKIAIKNDIKAVLVKKMRAVGEYVILKAKGSETILLSSGFELATHNGGEKLQKPTVFIILPGRNGEIIMKIKRVIGAKAYMYQYTSDDPASKDVKWETVYETRSKTVIKGLPLGVRFWFRVVVIGRGGAIVYTETLTRYIS
jgi:hypothetical protein